MEDCRVLFIAVLGCTYYGFDNFNFLQIYLYTEPANDGFPRQAVTFVVQLYVINGTAGYSLFHYTVVNNERYSQTSLIGSLTGRSLAGYLSYGRGR